METDTPKSVIRKEDVREIDYDSPEFKKGLEKIKNIKKLSQACKKIDPEKRDFGFNY